MEVTSSLNDVVCESNTTSIASRSLLVEQLCPLQQVTGSSVPCLDGGDNVTVIQCVPITSGTADTNMTSDPSLPLYQVHSSSILPTEGRTSEQDVLITAMCTSTCVSDYRTCVDDPLEEESPTPVNTPMCSTPAKSHTTLRMSRSPSIPLQNVSVETCYKVDATPVVLPKRMVALEGLYQADSPEVDHDHDSLDMFDDMVPSVPGDQQVNDGLDMFDNTSTTEINPVSDDQVDMMVDNTFNQSIKDNQNGIDDLFHNTASLVPNQPGKDCDNLIVDSVSSNQPVMSNQNSINMIADTASFTPNNPAAKSNQDGINVIVDTGPVVTSVQPVKENQNGQISDAVSHKRLVKDDLDQVPAEHSNKLIKANQSDIAVCDKTSIVYPAKEPFKEDQNVGVISSALFTPNQASLPHGHNDSPMDTSPLSSSSPALGDSISTQVSCMHCITVRPQ